MSEAKSMTTMLPDDLKIDPDLPVAFHYQLRTAIRQRIRASRLKPGQMLPTVRQIVGMSGLSVHTVTRAMRELAQEGIIVSRRGSGMRVAEPVTASTEVLFARRPPRFWSAMPAFFDQITEGLREGYGDEKRRIYMNYIEGEIPPACEILQVVRARHTDGVVAYRPHGALAGALREIAGALPTVALLQPVDGGRVDCVAADPADAVRSWTQRRFADGARQFAYIGFKATVEGPAESLSPYRAIFEAFHSACCAGGAAPAVWLHPAEDPPRVSGDDPGYAEMARFLERLPFGASAVVQNPHLAERVLKERPDLRAATYTECREALRLFRPRMTIFYLGLEMAARRAARHIQELNGSGRLGGGEVIPVQPEVHEGGGRV